MAKNQGIRISLTS